MSRYMMSTSGFNRRMRQEKELVAFVQSYKSERGRFPSMREIAKALDCSLGTVHTIVISLEDHGGIEFRGTCRKKCFSRSFVVTGETKSGGIPVYTVKALSASETRDLNKELRQRRIEVNHLNQENIQLIDEIKQLKAQKDAAQRDMDLLRDELQLATRESVRKTMAVLTEFPRLSHLSSIFETARKKPAWEPRPLLEIALKLGLIEITPKNEMHLTEFGKLFDSLV